jgi:hypothetical protein
MSQTDIDKARQHLAAADSCTTTTGTAAQALMAVGYALLDIAQSSRGEQPDAG